MTDTTTPPSPGQYAYAAAHLRAAIEHCRLALHYAGTDEVCMDELALVTIPDFLEGELRHCEQMAKGAS